MFALQETNWAKVEADITINTDVTIAQPNVGDKLTITNVFITNISETDSVTFRLKILASDNSVLSLLPKRTLYGDEDVTITGPIILVNQQKIVINADSITLNIFANGNTNSGV